MEVLGVKIKYDLSATTLTLKGFVVTADVDDDLKAFLVGVLDLEELGAVCTGLALGHVKLDSQRLALFLPDGKILVEVALLLLECGAQLVGLCKNKGKRKVSEGIGINTNFLVNMLNNSKFMSVNL